MQPMVKIATFDELADYEEVSIILDDFEHSHQIRVIDPLQHVELIEKHLRHFLVQHFGLVNDLDGILFPRGDLGRNPDLAVGSFAQCFSKSVLLGYIVDVLQVFVVLDIWCGGDSLFEEHDPSEARHASRGAYQGALNIILIKLLLIHENERNQN